MVNQADAPGLMNRRYILFVNLRRGASGLVLRGARFGRMPAPPALDLSNLPDADVVALAQKGRDSAFRELIRRYERPVF